MKTEAYIQIVWDDDYMSPIVGPFYNLTTARSVATRMRRTLRAHNHPFKKISAGNLISPMTAWAWDAFHQEI